MKQDKKYTVIDLFAGCGGLSLGLYQAGWDGLFAIEKNANAFETLNYNLIKGKKHFAWPKWLPQSCLDIIEVNENYSEQLIQLRGKVDLVAGGPPCQGFSMAGKRIEDDVRNQLVFSYIDFISMVQPKLILFENVKGFTYAFDKKKNQDAVPYSQIVTDKLRTLGYDVIALVIDFSKYGIPQRRKRFILVGVKDGDEGSARRFVDLLDAQKSKFLKHYNLSEVCTVSEAISDLLQENGIVETPDRKGFNSGIYGKIESPYQELMRKGLHKLQTIPNSHSFANHSEGKKMMFEKLLSD